MKIDLELEGVSVKFNGESDKGLSLLKNILSTIQSSQIDTQTDNHKDKEEVLDIDIPKDPRTKTDKKLQSPGLQKEILKYLSTGPVKLQELQKLLPNYNSKLFSIMNRLVLQKYVLLAKGKAGEEFSYQISSKGKRYLELIGNRYRIDKNASKALKQEFS